MPNHLLKLYAKATTPVTWMVVTVLNSCDPNPPETLLVDDLEGPEDEVVERAYAAARERGLAVGGHTVDVNALTRVGLT